MGAQRKRRRREEEREEEEQRDEERAREKEATPAAPADRALELQKTAGNRAVGAALARWGLPWIPMTATPQWPKQPQVIADGKVIPLKSWSWADAAPGAGGGVGAGRAQFSEVSVTTTQGEHSSDLLLRTAQGGPFKTVIIVVPGKDGKGMTLTFTDVLITAYQPSGDQETWTLSFAKKEFSQSPPPAQPPGR